MSSPESSPLQAELHAITALKERFDAALYEAKFTSVDTIEAEQLAQELTDN